MKKTILSLLLLVVATTASAQSLLLGDANQDGQLTVADVTKTANMIVHPEAQGSIDTYVVDNTKVVGTWYMPDATSFALRADGTTTFPGGATYKFYPMQGRLLVYDALGEPVRVLSVVEVTSDYILTVNYATETFTRYVSMESVVMMVSSITLSETSLTLEVNGNKQLTATVLPTNAANRSVTWTSSNTAVATVSSSGLVTAIATGTCTITCTAQDGSGVNATCEVTVGVADPHEYVDLGLPSGTLWATMNIGADSPEEYGDYFAWGETSGYNDGKTDFSWSNYTYCKESSSSNFTKYCWNKQFGYNGFSDTLTELELADDAAYVNWGPNWRMPSYDQFRELINGAYTTTTWMTVNDINCRKITSKTNGNSIFLPAAGYRDGASLDGTGNYGRYWSRSLGSSYPYSARYLNFDYSSSVYISTELRYFGQSVRPVRASQ